MISNRVYGYNFNLIAFSLLGILFFLLIFSVGVHASSNDIPLCEGKSSEVAEVARISAKQEVQAAQKYIDAHLNRSSPIFGEWFGDQSIEAKQGVAQKLRSIETWIDAAAFYCVNQTSFRENASGELQPIFVGYSEDLIAYVYPGDMMAVYLTPAFFNSGSNGFDTRMGTLVHEVSHFFISGGTKDFHYGREDCRKLARSNPSAALNNADNLQYFVESVSVR